MPRQLHTLSFERIGLKTIRFNHHLNTKLDIKVSSFIVLANSLPWKVIRPYEF